MKLLDDLFVVLESQADDAGFITTIKLNPLHKVYTGHFPGHPVTPGVIQMQIVHELLEKQLGKNVQLITVGQCKFLKTLNPNEAPLLKLHIKVNQINKELKIKAWGENNVHIFFRLESSYRIL